MKHSKILALALAGTLGFSASAFADRNQGFYLGAGVGTPDVDTDESDFDLDFDENETLHVTAGVNLGQGWALEYTHLEYDGDLEFDDDDGSFDADSNSLYGVWRSEGQLYFKGKAGMSRSSTEGRSAAARFSNDDTDFSAGAGVGLDLYPFTVEAEYTYVNEDINNFGIGLNLHF